MEFSLAIIYYKINNFNILCYIQTCTLINFQENVLASYRRIFLSPNRVTLPGNSNYSPCRCIIGGNPKGTWQISNVFEDFISYVHSSKHRLQVFQYQRYYSFPRLLCKLTQSSNTTSLHYKQINFSAAYISSTLTFL